VGTCKVCGKPAKRRGRCWTCYQFRRRTGRDRTPEMILAANVRRLDRELADRALVAMLAR